jgi:hypothetical protein
VLPIASALATIVNLSFSMRFSPAPFEGVGISSPEIQTTVYPSNGFCMKPEYDVHVVVVLMILCCCQSFTIAHSSARNDHCHDSPKKSPSSHCENGFAAL